MQLDPLRFPRASTADPTVTVPSPRTTHDAAAAAPMLAVVWCCTVGATWTLELRKLDGGRAPGTLVDWISSGVPIGQSRPDEALARELLAQRGLFLYQEPAVGPCKHSRHGIGYVREDPGRAGAAGSTTHVDDATAPPAPTAERVQAMLLRVVRAADVGLLLREDVEWIRAQARSMLPLEPSRADPGHEAQLVTR